MRKTRSCFFRKFDDYLNIFNQMLHYHEKNKIPRIYLKRGREKAQQNLEQVSKDH